MQSIDQSIGAPVAEAGVGEMAAYVVTEIVKWEGIQDSLWRQSLWVSMMDWKFASESKDSE